MWAIKILNTLNMSAEGTYLENSKQRKILAESYNTYVAKRRVNVAGKEIKIKWICLMNYFTALYNLAVFNESDMCGFNHIPLTVFNSNNDTLTDWAKSKMIKRLIIFLSLLELLDVWFNYTRHSWIHYWASFSMFQDYTV